MSTYRERVAEYERMYRASDSPPLTAREASRLAVIEADLDEYDLEPPMALTGIERRIVQELKQQKAGILDQAKQRSAKAPA